MTKTNTLLLYVNDVPVSIEFYEKSCNCNQLKEARALLCSFLHPA